MIDASFSIVHDVPKIHASDTRVFWVCVITLIIAPIMKIPPSTFNTTFMNSDTVVPVRLELDTAQLPERNILYVMDTAPTTASIKEVLSKGYGELMTFISRNKLQAGQFMAWYYAMQEPWPIDAAVSVNRLPKEFEGRIHGRVLASSKAVVAHMWGPYDQVNQAYEQLAGWVSQNKRKPRGHPYEVYLNDPSSVKPEEIRTDIIQEIE